MYKLLRETPWIKEWQTPFGVFIDSKLRWLGIEPSGEVFIAAWKKATDAEKFDLEAAFQFYPYELADDIDAITDAITLEDESRARRMREKLFGPDSRLTPEQERFLNGLGEHLEKTKAPMRLIGENKWFTAYANEAGFHIDSKVNSPLEMPTDEELQIHANASLSLAYRRIVLTVKENRWLLEQPGISPF